MNAVINFLIVAFAIFWVVKAVSKLYHKPEPPPPPPSPTETLLAEIRDLLRDRPDAIAAPAVTPIPPGLR
jgi:large conductance mechanosensitive channel